MSNSCFGYDPAPPGKCEIKKIIADSDLDGVIAATMLQIVYPNAQVKLADPSSMQEGKFDELIDKYTVITDLKYVVGCGLYFDHHESNKPTTNEFPGCWRKVDSAARVVYDYYKNHYNLQRFAEIVDEVDKLDMGKVTLDEFLHPSGVIKLGLAISSDDQNFSYLIIDLLTRLPWTDVLETKAIKDKLEKTAREREEALGSVGTKLEVTDNVIIADLDKLGAGVKVSSYVFVAKFPGTDCAVVFKPADSPEGFKVRMYRNNFNKKAFDYDLLEIARAINPDFSGGHKSACGFTPTAGSGREEVKKRILSELNKQKSRART